MEKKYKNMTKEDKIFFLERRVSVLVDELMMCRDEIKNLREMNDRLLNNAKRNYKESRKLAVFEQSLRDELKIENTALKEMLRNKNAS